MATDRRSACPALTRSSGSKLHRATDATTVFRRVRRSKPRFPIGKIPDSIASDGIGCSTAYKPLKPSAARRLVRLQQLLLHELGDVGFIGLQHRGELLRRRGPHDSAEF